MTLPAVVPSWALNSWNGSVQENFAVCKYLPVYSPAWQVKIKAAAWVYTAGLQGLLLFIHGLSVKQVARVKTFYHGVEEG